MGDWMWWIFRLTGVAIYGGMFLAAVMYFVPKAVTSYALWKTTNKSSHLSISAGAAVCAFFFIAADFVIFIKAFIEGGIPCIK